MLNCSPKPEHVQQECHLHSYTVASLSIISHCSFHVPQLYSFDFLANGWDRSTATVLMILYFSRWVDVSTFSCADIAFSSSRTAASSRRLTESQCTMLSGQNNYIMQFSVQASVLPGYAGVPGSTWIHTADATVTKDIHGNSLAPILVAAAIEWGPQVIRFSVDMNSGLVMMTVPSTLRGPWMPAFKLSSIGFYTTTLASALDSAVQLYTSQSFYLQEDAATTLTVLNPGQPPSNGSVIQLQLSNGNLNKLKLLDVGPSRLFLIIKNSYILDYNNISVANIVYPFLNPLVPSEFSMLGQMMVSLFRSDAVNPDLQIGEA